MLGSLNRCLDILIPQHPVPLASADYSVSHGLPYTIFDRPLFRFLFFFSYPFLSGFMTQVLDLPN
jgi:hypothetical protein